MAQGTDDARSRGEGYRDESSEKKKQGLSPGGILKPRTKPRFNPWVVGTFGVSSLLAGLHLGKASCGDGGNRADCVLGAFYTGLMGFSGAKLMMRDMPDPDEPGTPVEPSTGGG